MDKIENPERDIVIRHILVTAQILFSGGNVSNCLIHPSVRQAAHQKFALSIKAELDWCKANLTGNFIDEIKKQYALIKPQKSSKAPFAQIMEIASHIIMNNEAKIIIMNGKNDVDSSEYSTGCNFVIGGNTLGRGVTFPALQTLYYHYPQLKQQK